MDVWDRWIIASVSSLALLGLKSIRDCLAQHHFLGLFQRGVPMRKGPKSLLGASCVSDIIFVGLLLQAQDHAVQLVDMA